MALYTYAKKKPRIISKKRRGPIIIPFVLIFIGIGIIGYVAYPYFSYYLALEFKIDNFSKAMLSPSDNITAYAATDTSNSDYNQNVSQNISDINKQINDVNDFSNLADIKGLMYLTIDKLGLNHIPININTPSDSEAEYDSVLTHSLAHFKGTSLPGYSGKTFIYGHSSRTLVGGKSFSSIFSDLDSLNLGDEFTISYNGTDYKYSVYKVKVVNRDDLTIIKGDNKKTVSLMTCVPKGVGSQRLIVDAIQEEN